MLMEIALVAVTLVVVALALASFLAPTRIGYVESVEVNAPAIEVYDDIGVGSGYV